MQYRRQHTCQPLGSGERFLRYRSRDNGLGFLLTGIIIGSGTILYVGPRLQNLRWIVGVVIIVKWRVLVLTCFIADHAQ